MCSLVSSPSMAQSVCDAKAHQQDLRLSKASNATNSGFPMRPQQIVQTIYECRQMPNAMIPMPVANVGECNIVTLSFHSRLLPSSWIALLFHLMDHSARSLLTLLWPRSYCPAQSPILHHHSTSSGHLAALSSLALEFQRQLPPCQIVLLALSPLRRFCLFPCPPYYCSACAQRHPSSRMKYLTTAVSLPNLSHWTCYSQHRPAASAEVAG